MQFLFIAIFFSLCSFINLFSELQNVLWRAFKIYAILWIQIHAVINLIPYEKIILICFSTMDVKIHTFCFFSMFLLDIIPSKPNSGINAFIFFLSFFYPYQNIFFKALSYVSISVSIIQYIEIHHLLATGF